MLPTEAQFAIQRGQKGPRRQEVNVCNNPAPCCQSLVCMPERVRAVCSSCLVLGTVRKCAWCASVCLDVPVCKPMQTCFRPRLLVPRALDQKLQVVCRLHAQDAVNGVAVTHTSPHAETTPVFFFFFPFCLSLGAACSTASTRRRGWAPCPFFSLLLFLLLFLLSAQLGLCCCLYDGVLVASSDHDDVCFSDPRRRDGHCPRALGPRWYLSVSDPLEARHVKRPDWNGDPKLDAVRAWTRGL